MGYETENKLYKNGNWHFNYCHFIKLKILNANGKEESNKPKDRSEDYMSIG